MDSELSPRITYESGEELKKTHLLQSQRSGVIGLIIAYSGGLIKNEKQATFVVLAFIVTAFVLSGYVFISGTPPDQGVPSVPTPEDIYIKQLK